MLINVNFIVISVLPLFLGAESLVRGSASIGRRAGLSSLVIGLTVVAFGTSSPELAVSLKASFAGHGDIAIGNVVGSNISNTGVILGLTALICPVAVQRQIIRIDAPLMIVFSLLLPLILGNRQIGRLEGGIVFAALCVYTFFNVIVARKATVYSAFDAAHHRPSPAGGSLRNGCASVRYQ